ncbi:acetylxylan esterase [Verrucomicrobiaceae bacterium 227]
MNPFCLLFVAMILTTITHLWAGEDSEVSLPDPLLFSNGQRVVTKEDWQRRRGEIRAMILDIEYGCIPPAPEHWEAEVTSEKEVFGSKAIDRRVTLTFGRGESAFTMRAGFLIPNIPGHSEKFAVVIKNDVAIGHIPISERLIEEGYIVAEYLRTDLDPDVANVVGPAQKVYPSYDWGTLAVWAWGGMRIIDYVLTLPQVDSKQIAVFGHSRGGKVALLTGALDERVAVSLPNGSGAGGAGLFRNQSPKAESLAEITDPERFGYWLHPKLRSYAGKEQELPFDQHFLRALIAPRGIFSTDALGDLWANPKGTREARDAAVPVFEFLGATDSANACHFREGGHGETVKDWEAALEFMNQQFHLGPRKP